MSYNVARQVGEIGIRMALGAQRGTVLWMVLRRVLLLAAVGLAISVPAALVASRLVKSFLFGTQPNDPGTLALAGVVLLSAAILAGLLTAIQLLPVLEFTRQSGRAASGGSHDIYPFSLEPLRLLEFVWPNLYGSNFSGNRSWLALIPYLSQHAHVWVPSLYLGGMTFILALGVLGFRNATPWRGWLSAIAIISLVASMGVFSLLKGSWLAIFFAVFVAFSATQMFLDKKPAPTRQMPGTGGQIAAGGFIGFLSGLVGAGGGFVSVPFMTWCNVAIHNAVATSAALGFPIAVANVAGYIVGGRGVTGLSGYLNRDVHRHAVVSERDGQTCRHVVCDLRLRGRRDHHHPLSGE